MAFKVEKKIEMPPLGIYGRRLKYPFHKMNVGDSFLCGDSSQNAVRSAAAQYGYRESNGAKFSVRKTPDGYRCWRIA